MNDIETILKRIEDRVSMATSDPWESFWRINDNGEADCGVFHQEKPGHVHSVCRAPRYQTQEQWGKDGEFIASARTDVPRLVQALRIVVNRQVVEQNQTDRFVGGVSLTQKDWLNICKILQGEQPLTTRESLEEIGKMMKGRK